MDSIIDSMKGKTWAILIVGDPLCATTHMDLYLRATKKQMNVIVIHNASIMTACAISGMLLYKFGETVSIPYFTKTWKPLSFYDKIFKNRQNNLHTLLLLDIKTKEKTVEALLSGSFWTRIGFE